MPNHIQAGTIMVQPSESLHSLGIESEAYCETWQSLGVRESSALDRKLRDSGWNLFYMADELKTAVPAWGGQTTLRRGVKRLLSQTCLQHFNCLELTHILKKHFLGIPYVSIAGHSRHIQQGSQIQSMAQRLQNAGPADLGTTG